MLDFIWHLRGSVPLESVGSDDAALDRVERLLERQWKGTNERGGDYVAFDDPVSSRPLAPGWLAMAVYDRGRFWIEEGSGGRKLRYDLRSLHCMVFCSLGSIMFFFLGLASSGVARGFVYAAGVFAWLYGMNILLAFARIHWTIRRAVRAE